MLLGCFSSKDQGHLTRCTSHHGLHEILRHFKLKSGWIYQEIKTESSLNPAGHGFDAYVQISTKIWTLLKTCGVRRVPREGFGMIRKDSVKRYGLKCPALYSPSLGENLVLFYWQKEVIHSVKCRGANNHGTFVFVESNYFLMRGLFFSE